MKILRKIAIGFTIFVALIVLFGAGMMVATRGEYAVPSTVENDPTLPQIEIDGVRFHAESFGDPADPTVIVVHGGPGGDFGYLLNLHVLEDAYHVVFYDQQGAGLSPRIPAESLTLQSSVDDLHRIVTHFGDGEPVRIIGHSWGAMLTAAYVGQHPDSVSHAVLAEPGALDNARLEEFLQRQTGSQDLGYYRKLVSTIFETLHIDLPDEHAQQDYIYGKMTAFFVDSDASGYRCADESVMAVQPEALVPASRFGATAYQTLFGATADLSPIAKYADNFNGDVLFLAGECSDFIGASLQQQQMRTFPQATLEVVPDAGHEMFSENPNASIEIVREFFDDAVKTSSR